ncbi:MAG: arsenic transporter, partial [Oscillospiraceae bacterium]|nr:arsenic transporter [Oscillospiraceae bacterium]
MTLALIIFAVTYILLMTLTKYRAFIAVASAIVFVVLGILPVGKVPGAIDWNVIMMIGGAMGIVSLFIESKMPARMADILIDKVPNVKWAVIAMAVFAGVISAFVDNVATVLMVAPVALSIAKKLNLRPAPIIIAIAISSNLQGAATLVGDTTSILLGGYAGMDFLDFFFFQGRPGLFWITEIGALAATIILAFFFRKEKQPIESGECTKVTDYFPTV